jgi:hypothetical protein
VPNHFVVQLSYGGKVNQQNNEANHIGDKAWEEALEKCKSNQNPAPFLSNTKLPEKTNQPDKTAKHGILYASRYMGQDGKLKPLNNTPPNGKN